MKEELESWIDSKSDWPILTTSIAKKWLNDGDGLQDRGITRDLNWGVPVKKGQENWPGMDGKVFYVWFDAPIEYIACAEEWVDAGKEKIGIDGGKPTKEQMALFILNLWVKIMFHFTLCLSQLPS